MYLDLLRQQAPLGEVIHKTLGDALAQLQRRSGYIAVLVKDDGGQVVVGVVVTVAAVVQGGPTELYSGN